MPKYGKYGEVTTGLGQFHHDEPIFLIRAQDRNAVETIQAYADICENDNCDSGFVGAVLDRAQEFSNWQSANPDLVKKPD